MLLVSYEGLEGKEKDVSDDLALNFEFK